LINSKSKQKASVSRKDFDCLLLFGEGRRGELFYLLIRILNLWKKERQ